MICNRGNHADTVSFWAVSRTIGVLLTIGCIIRIVLDTRFVSPVDFCLFLFGFGRDTRIGSFKPFLHGFRVLLVGSL